MTRVEPFQHGIARESTGALQEPPIGRGRPWILDLESSGVLDEWGIAGERERGLDPGRQDHIQSALGAQHDVDRARWKIELLLIDHALVSNLLQRLSGKRLQS